MWQFGQTQQQQSAKPDWLQDGLTSQQLRSQTNHETEYGKATHGFIVTVCEAIDVRAVCRTSDAGKGDSHS